RDIAEIEALQHLGNDVAAPPHFAVAEAAGAIDFGRSGSSAGFPGHSVAVTFDGRGCSTLAEEACQRSGAIVILYGQTYNVSIWVWRRRMTLLRRDGSPLYHQIGAV